MKTVLLLAAVLLGAGDNDGVGVLPAGLAVDELEVAFANGTTATAYLLDGWFVGIQVRGVWLCAEDVPPIPATVGWPCAVWFSPPADGGQYPDAISGPVVTAETLQQAVTAFHAAVDALEAQGAWLMQTDGC